MTDPVPPPPRKSRLDLVPGRALLEVGQVYAAGAEKHPERGHLERHDIDAELAAAMRHLAHRIDGAERDEDGLAHLACAAARCLNALGMELRDTAHRDFIRDYTALRGAPS